MSPANWAEMPKEPEPELFDYREAIGVTAPRSSPSGGEIEWIRRCPDTYTRVSRDFREGETPKKAEEAEGGVTAARPDCLSQSTRAEAAL